MNQVHFSSSRQSAPLMAPFAWTLHSWVQSMPVLAKMGALGLLTTATLLLVWLAAVVRDVSSDSLPLAALLGMLLVSGAWLWHAVLAWLRWQTAQAVLCLVWSGRPVKSVQSGRQVDPSVQPGGWCVQQWGDGPVRVRLVFDWQRWMLLHLQEQRTWPSRRQVWMWVDAHDLTDAHRLRTLLHLPESQTTLPGGHAASSSKPMASWRHKQPSGTILTTSAFPSTQFLPTEIQVFDELEAVAHKEQA
jgi:hypothetical protein